MSPLAEIPTRTVVLGMIRRDGTLVADDLYRVTTAIGMSDQQIRLCLRRLVHEGVLSQEGRGRRAVFRATDDARARILPELEFLDLAVRRDRGEDPWDGRWRLVAFAVPESERPVRDRLRERLVELGAVAIQGGLYISANDLTAHLRPKIDELGIARYVAHLSTADLDLGGTTDPGRIAAVLWDLAGTQLAWQNFLDDLDRRLAVARRRDLDPDAELAVAIEVAVAFSRCMLRDPILPRELLPRPWAGTRARERFAEAWALLSRGTGAADELSLLAGLGPILGTR